MLDTGEYIDSSGIAVVNPTESAEVERRNRTAEIVDEEPFSDEEREQAVIGESAKLGVKVCVMTLWYSTTKIYKQ